MVESVLKGIRVLDFSRIFAGPAATQVLGDLGAEIIKIEEPGRGDDARTFGVTETAMEEFGASPSFLALNRNKRSMVLDLKIPSARAVAADMAARCDVLVHNFRPGGMAKFGLDYETLAVANPRLVYCEFSAYGTEGPLSHLGANDVALQAHSGLMSITGESDRPAVRSGTAVIDLHASLGLVSAVLAALFHRERTGKGQRVETSLLLSGAHLMNYFYTEYWLDGTVRQRMGTANHLSVPNQAFPARDGSVIIIAPADDMWRRCAHALAPEKLDRPAFKTAFDRRQHRDELIAALTDVTRTMSCKELVDRLGAVKVNVSKVNDVGEAADDAQLAAIGGVVEQRMGERTLKSVQMPFAMSATPAVADLPPPRHGEHTDEILSEFGYDAAAIEALRAEEALGRA
ncbi:CoA:oxalate CoA-transferase [Faunimonas pinastri]|uniref:CoA:oxalate CoA-transferase n=1 Tax=Faunimonas pinastri TaxID=1855383 RepID=A0A1H9EDU6_9HYPH|nr:CoA transferase [Faunimonas pinastri]SEQ23904.1 CoA:oxalate CoA-transferase [Faunimonas pinastri]